MLGATLERTDRAQRSRRLAKWGAQNQAQRTGGVALESARFVVEGANHYMLVAAP